MLVGISWNGNLNSIILHYDMKFPMVKITEGEDSGNLYIEQYR